jgi:hypothetical protein
MCRRQQLDGDPRGRPEVQGFRDPWFLFDEVIHEVADRFGDTIQNMIPRNVSIVAQDNADPINSSQTGAGERLPHRIVPPGRRPLSRRQHLQDQRPGARLTANARRARDTEHTSPWHPRPGSARPTDSAGTAAEVMSA